MKSSPKPRRRKRNLGHLSIGLFAFCATLLAVAPASLLIPAIKHNAPNLSFSTIEGSVWSAQIKHLTVENIGFGNVAIQFSFLSLLHGEVAYFITVDDEALDGTLIAKRTIPGNIVLQTGSLEIGPSIVSRMALLGVRLDGTINISDAQIVLRDNECRQSTGYVETNILRAPAAQFGMSAPELTGNIICRDGMLGVELAGGEQSFGNVSIDLFSHTPQHMVLKAVLSLNDKTLEDALKLSGFEENGNAIQFEQIVGL